MIFAPWRLGVRSFSRRGAKAQSRKENKRYDLVYRRTSMGKGDQRSRRGKIWRGTFGKRRPKKKNIVKATGQPVAPPPKNAEKTESE